MKRGKMYEESIKRTNEESYNDEDMADFGIAGEGADSSNASIGINTTPSAHFDRGSKWSKYT